jgi:hypothetical protein
LAIEGSNKNLQNGEKILEIVDDLPIEIVDFRAR